MFDPAADRNVDVLLEFFRQASLNMRMFVDLRFKHFTTFIVITGLLGGIMFKVPEVATYRAQIATISFLITALFWFIDFRTSQLFWIEAKRISVFERALNHGTNLILEQSPKFKVRAGFVTNMLFFLFSAGWITLAVTNAL